MSQLLMEEEISKHDSPLIGAVAYLPEKYGGKILPVALQCLNGKAVPPAVYVEHKLIARDQAPASSVPRLAKTRPFRALAITL
jgi:hypothetical protein